MIIGRRVQAIDLVVEHRGGQIEMNRALPLAAPPRCAPAIDDDDGKALVGEPLRQSESAPRCQHVLNVRATVGIEQHRKRGAVVIVRQQYGGSQAAAAVSM